MSDRRWILGSVIAIKISGLLRSECLIPKIKQVYVTWSSHKFIEGIYGYQYGIFLGIIYFSLLILVSKFSGAAH